MKQWKRHALIIGACAAVVGIGAALVAAAAAGAASRGLLESYTRQLKETGRDEEALGTSQAARA